MQWILDNATNVFAVIGALYSVALIVVKLTPTPRDDAALENVSVVLRGLAVVFGLTLKQGLEKEVVKTRVVPGLKEAGALLLALALVGCVSPGDQYQASALAFQAAVEAATELRAAGALTPDQVSLVDVAVDDGSAILEDWARALKAGEDYPDGVTIMALVVRRIQLQLGRRE